MVIIKKQFTVAEGLYLKGRADPKMNILSEYLPNHLAARRSLTEAKQGWAWSVPG